MDSGRAASETSGVAVGNGKLLGRAAERDALAAALARARDGSSGVVLLTGEAGIGKTRLVEELCAQAGPAVRVRVGESVPEVGAGLAYGPFAAALADEADWLLADDANVDPLIGRHRLFKRVLDTLGRLAAAAPQLLVLEDLHWADESSRALLAFLAVTLREQPLLVVATMREHELPEPDARWLAEVSRRPRVQRMRLAGLPARDIATLVAERLAPDAGTDRLGAVVAAADGNPLVAQELAAAGPRELPASLAEAVLARLAGAPAAVREVLEQVSAADGPLSHETLARTVALSEESLLTAVRAAVDLRLLTASGEGYRFRHVLTRQVVYDELLPGERRRLHRRVAEVLEAVHDPRAVGARVPSPADLATLAYHWHRAGSPERAAPAALDAARQAAAARAYPEAHRLYTMAIELIDRLPADEPRYEVLREGAEAAQACGAPRAAVGYTRQALAQAPDDAQVRGRLLERLGRYHWEAGEAREAVQARQDAVELLAREPASAPYARALAALATGRMLLGEPAEAMRVAGRAVAAARAVADPAAETHALATLGVLQAQAGDPDTGLSTLEHSAAVAEELGSVEDVVRAAANRCYLLCTAGRFAEAVDVAQEGRRVARRSGAPPAATAILDNNTAAVLVTTGQWQRAGTFLDELLAEGSAHVARLQLLQLELAVGEGRRDLVGPLVAAILEGRDDPRLVAPVRACLAEAALFDGDLTAAARAVLAGLDALRGRSLVEEEARLLAAGCRVTADLAALPGAALSGAALSGAALSGTASDRLPPGWATAAAEFPVRAQRLLDAHGEAQPETAAYAACALAEARRAGREDDRAGWRAVAARWHRAGQPYRESYARLREAESTARAGRRDQAARALAACVGLAEQLPAAPLLALAHTLAARARIAVPDGADPVGSGPTGAPGAAGAAARHDLTDRELQVLARLAGGDSNRQIARALYISERTVAVHVGHILDKLNVRNRTEAAAAAAALDLSGSGPTAPDQKGNT